LDQRFGRQTLAAKMTDVPGHTLGMVPLMAEAGLKFLHLGVNTASPVPDVPPIFRWQAPEGEEIVVMYQGSYGATDFPSGGDIGLSFAHTSDNIGPQSVGQTVEALRHIVHEFPDARIVASTLDAFGEAMWERRERFPVITQEVGDSWIHGTGSDPQKLRHFRALGRVYDGFCADLSPTRAAFGRALTMVAEHTWGVDIKTYLRDDKAWDRPEFEAARKSDYRFAYAEASWAEQRAYLDAAIGELDATDQASSKAALRQSAVPAEILKGPGDHLENGGWIAELDAATGDIAALVSPSGRRIDGVAGSLLGYRHESYDWTELQTHLDSYLQHRQEWAILDHDKPGLRRARTARSARFVPEGQGISEDGARAFGHMPQDAQSALGAPSRHELILRGIDDHSVEIALVLRGKPANRMPEAGFLTLTPQGARAWELEKLGLWHKACEIVRGGGGQLQAVSALRYEAASFDILDSALVAPAGAPFMPFQPELPDFGAGMRINLYNNKWGTNFPMWWEGDLLSRIVLRLR